VSDRDRDPRAAPRVAIIARQGKFLVAEPFFGVGPRLAVSRDKRYDVGDLVELSGAQSAASESGPDSGGSGSGGSGSGRKGGSRRPKVLRRLGRPDVARDVITALMLDRGLEGRFDPAVGRSARDASEREVEAAGRRDLRDLPTFTIDPVTARDFDDAISAESTTDGGWRVWVHIADVSFYVPQRSLVDREAYRRATSVYVPG
jgi:ribonuclease R